MTTTDSDSAQDSQATISDEIARIHDDYQRAGVEETQPRLDYAPYRSSLLRHPTKDLAPRRPRDDRAVRAGLRAARRRRARVRPDHPAQRRAGRRADRRHRSRARRRRTPGAPPARRDLAGERRPGATSTSATSTRRRSTRTSPASAARSPTTTAATRSPRSSPAPTRGRTTTTPGGRRTSTSRCSGTEFTQRMITQMYFPGDPLFALDPIYQSIVDPKARERLVASYDHDVTQHEWATGYRWDIVLTGSHRTPMEEEDHVMSSQAILTATPGQTVGPFFGYALPYPGDERAGAAGSPRRDPPARHGVRRRRRPGPRRAARDLAGRRGRRACPQTEGSLRRDGCTFTGFGRAAVDARRALLLHHACAPARPTTVPRVLRDDRLRPRAAEPAVHPGLPARRRGCARRRPAARVGARGPSRRRWSPPRTRDGYAFDIRLQGDGETVFLAFPGS